MWSTALTAVPTVNSCSCYTFYSLIDDTVAAAVAWRGWWISQPNTRAATPRNEIHAVVDRNTPL